MKRVDVKGLEVIPQKGSAFAYETAPDLPKCHVMALVVGARGMGKTTAAISLMERLPYDRIFAISPSMKSNHALMQRLKIAPEDVYEDVDDLNNLTRIRAAIDAERDDLERYHDEMKRWKELMRKIEDDGPLATIPGTELSYFFRNNDFPKPEHRWKGKRCCMALLIDDCVGSTLYTKPRALNKFVTTHRHLGQLTEGGALGCSVYCLVQSFRCSSGGVTKCVRNQATCMIMFGTKSKRELDEVAEECAAEVDEQLFKRVYAECMQERHDFMFIDYFRKETHPSSFRRNFNQFIIPSEIASPLEPPCSRRTKATV